MRRSFVLGAVVLALLAVGLVPAAAQEATPAGTPIGTPAGECDAPPLPAGTPTPMEELAEPAEAEDQAADTPVAEEPAEAASPDGAPAPEGVPADEATAARMVAGYENFLRCSALGFAGASLFTDNMILFFTGTTNPYDLIAAFEGEPPTEQIYGYGNVLAYPDGRFSIDETERTGQQVNAFRWYLVEEDGYVKLDGVDFGRPVDPALIGGTSSLVEVGLYDYAFGPETNAVTRADLVTFRGVNRGTKPHVLYVVQYPEGTTAEQVIAGEVDALEGASAEYGGWFVMPGETADVALVGLAPGTYFMICDVQTETGTPHYHLGMVAEFTVE